MRGKHYEALRWAVVRAAEWRGSLVGHYEDDDESLADETRRLAEFDVKVKAAKQALKVFMLTPSKRLRNLKR